MKRFAVLVVGVVALGASPLVLAQDWIALQDGKSLAGWKPAERPESWVVEDGAFVSRGDRSHLFYVGKVGKHDFRNFEFQAEVMTSPGANSGIYVHTKWQGPGWPEAGYELQVINSNPPASTMNGYIEYKMTASVYAVRNTWQAPVADNVWFNYRIRVVGKTIQTFINDQLICEYAEPADAFRPKDKKGRLLSSGTFALQAHDPASVVKYRNMKVRILPNDATPPAGLVPLADSALDQLITQASNDNIPLIDLGMSAPANGADEFWSQARRYGVLPLAIQQIPNIGGSVAVLVDRDRGPDVELLKSLKARGYRVAFSSGGVTSFDEAQLKRRLQAITDAGLGWKDFWVPGKP
ncbi:MAG TPA: DUF1080 domain-containing protein [Steroidobacteraceae bacterium]